MTVGSPLKLGRPFEVYVASAVKQDTCVLQQAERHIPLKDRLTCGELQSVVSFHNHYCENIRCYMKETEHCRDARVDANILLKRCGSLGTQDVTADRPPPPAELVPTFWG
jgi:hypothetical protein